MLVLVPDHTRSLPLPTLYRMVVEILADARKFEIGYHTLPFFLSDWDRFKIFPLGVLAHSTHVRGSGVMENGIEKPNVQVTLSSKISAEDCARLNLGYLDTAKVNIESFENREVERILNVPRAGEILYRKIAGS